MPHQNTAPPQFPPFDARAFGAKLRDLRRKKGDSQQHAAELSGTTISTLQRWEGGHPPPSLRVLAALAELYGVSLSELFA